MQLKNVICLGVAGNFANHLEQAGELNDFKKVITDDPNAPKGIFPFYLPNSDTFLGTYPIGIDKLNLPKYESNIQVEPEIAILFDIIYDKNKNITDLVANKFTTFNDCSIRKDGASKISEKKSWGANSKGIGNKWINIDSFEKGGIMDSYNLCSFLERDGVMYHYGSGVSLLNYSYFYTKLKLWLITKINTQKDFGPLENIKQQIKNSNYPKQTLITIGATDYEEFGRKNYLKPNDIVYIIAYDKNKDIANTKQSKSKIILKQKVS